MSEPPEKPAPASAPAPAETATVTGELKGPHRSQAEAPSDGGTGGAEAIERYFPSLSPSALEPSAAAITRRSASLFIEGPPPAPLRFASSLEEARRGTVVHIDGDGQVRSPTRYRILSALSFGATSGLMVAGTAAWVALFGPAGAAVAAFLGGAYVVGLKRRRQLVQAVALISAGRLSEAEALCRETLSGRMVPRRLRAAAHHNLSLVAMRRGDFGEALVELHRAARLRRSGGPRGIELDLLAYEEIRLLVNLGRVGEARTRLESRGPVPDGDYLRYLHRWAELAVQFAEGQLTWVGDKEGGEELWEWSRSALRISGASHLLALCAWAHEQRAETEMSEHLIEEAIDRAEPDSVVTFPSLWAWVEKHRPLRHPR